MLFALARDGRLLALSSVDDAASHCKAIDVRNAAWRFFADDGSPLEARFEQAQPPGNAPASAGAYVLVRAMSGLWLQERLEHVRKVEGCGPGNVAELVELLKINRGKRIPTGFKRG